MPKPYFQSCYRLNFLFSDTEEELRGVAVVSGVRHRGETTDHLCRWWVRDETADVPVDTQSFPIEQHVRNYGTSHLSFLFFQTHKTVVTGQSNVPSQSGVVVLSSLWYLSVLFLEMHSRALVCILFNFRYMPSICGGMQMILRNCGVIAGCWEAETKL